MGVVMRRVIEIEQVGDNIVFIKLDNQEEAILHRWGNKDCYIVTSENLNKSTLSDFKKSCVELGFNAEMLREKWLTK